MAGFAGARLIVAPAGFSFVAVALEVALAAGAKEATKAAFGLALAFAVAEAVVLRGAKRSAADHPANAPRQDVQCFMARED